MRIEPIEMTIKSQAGSERRTFAVGSVGGARFSSRDVDAMRRQLDEMIAREGRYSAATRTNPAIFRIGRYLLTQADTFDVQGPLTGGEGEVVAIRDGRDVFVTVGSDQCDRELDPLFPDKPKQMCPHPLASVAWPYEEVHAHWDNLRVYSHVKVRGHTIPLQDCPLSELVSLDDLLAMDVVQSLPDPMFLYCGSAPFLDSAAGKINEFHLPAETRLGVGEEFFVRLQDPVRGRTIEHCFRPIPLGDDVAERLVYGSDSRSGLP